MIETSRFPPLLVGVALVILAQQAADLATLLPAADFGSPAGRVGQLLAAQARTPAMVVADLLLGWGLVAGGYSGALRVVAGVHAGGGALLLVWLPWFLIDAGRLAVGFAEPESSSFRIVVARTLLQLVVAGLAALLAARILLVAAREELPRPA